MRIAISIPEVISAIEEFNAAGKNPYGPSQGDEEHSVFLDIFAGPAPVTADSSYRSTPFALRLTSTFNMLPT
jgi:hypothetical protein